MADDSTPRRFEHHIRHQVPPKAPKPHYFVAENGKRSFSANGAETFLEFKYWRLVDHLYGRDGARPRLTFDSCAEVAFRGMRKPVDAKLWLLSNRFDINEQLGPIKLRLEVSEESGVYLKELG